MTTFTRRQVIASVALAAAGMMAGSSPVVAAKIFRSPPIQAHPVVLWTVESKLQRPQRRKTTRKERT